MRILILGAYGMLGHSLWRTLGKKYEVYATCRNIRPDLDRIHGLDSARLIPDVTVERFNSVIESIASTRPDFIVNCIGIVKQKAQAKEAIASIQINASFPHGLACLCKTADTHLLHFSTDCVFSGRKGMYTEADISDAEDLYGRTKYLGEVGGEGCTTIRSSFIGREIAGRRGLLEWLLSNRGGSVRGFTNAVYSGFTTMEMTRIVSLIIENRPKLFGVWHVASTPIRKFDLLSEINSRLKLGITIYPDDSFRCDRSLNAEAFNRESGYSPPSWDAMIDELSGEGTG